jgi:fatty-acyl-CoA synthase
MQGLMQDYPLSITHIFDRAETIHPAKKLVTATFDGVHHADYRTWAERTRRLAGAFDALGLGADARIGTFAWNTQRHLELYFAAPCSGRILHTVNLRLFPEQIAFVVNHAEDEILFVDRSVIGMLWPLTDKLSSVKHYVVMDDGKGDIPEDDRIVDYEQLIADCDPVEFAPVDEQQAAAMCYTSGTTGNPKGVVYSHRSVFLHSLGAMVADGNALCERDVMMPVVPMFHANAWGLPHAAVFTGAAQVFPGPDLSPDGLCRLIQDEKVTMTAGVPTVWMGMLEAVGRYDLSSLDRIMGGGSAIPKELSEGFRARVGLPITQGWGMTETSPVASLSTLKGAFAEMSDDEKANYRAAQGIPLPCVEARIVEPGSIESLPWDGKTSGELQCRGPWIARAYYKDEEATAEQFTEDGWLRTGDVATIDAEGYIRLVDRTKDLVKSGGEWISSVELENEIMGHPCVAEAAVIAVTHPRWVERPLACVVVKEGESVSKEEILSFLDGRVAKWWVPDDVVFIDEVPKTSVGKFSKKTLRERFFDYELPSD